MVFLISYLIFATIYGFYSIMMQYFRHPNFCYWQNLVSVFIFNFVLAPFSIIYAAVNKKLIPYNLIKALKDQGPFKRAFRNFFITRNAWGMFHINSHRRQDTKKAKVMYNTKESAQKAADSMTKKHGKHFSVYKCVFCDGYHLGKNRDNK